MHKYAITEAPSVLGHHPAHPGVAARIQSMGWSVFIRDPYGTRN
jgi:hypothetical protein